MGHDTFRSCQKGTGCAANIAKQTIRCIVVWMEKSLPVCLFNPFPHSVPIHVSGKTVLRLPDAHGFSGDVAFRQQAPVAAVLRIVTVVTCHEVVVLLETVSN